MSRLMHDNTCPLCAAHGYITPSSATGRYAEIDDGCTEPVCGTLCDGCDSEYVDAASIVD